MPDSMIFYKSFYEAVKELTPKQQAEIYNAVFSYGLEGIEPKLSGISATVFKLIKPQIDANTKRRENGKKGGRPSSEKLNETDGFGNKKPNQNQIETKTKPNVNVNVNVNANDNANENVNANENENVNDNANALKEKNKKEKPVYYPNDEILNQAFTDYVAMRKQIKKPMTEKAIDLAIKELERLSEGDPDIAVKILNQSVMNSWQGLFELKEHKIKDRDKGITNAESWFAI